MSKLGSVTATDVVVAGAMAVVIGCVVVERCWLWRREGDARLAALRTAGTMGVGALFVGAVVTVAEQWAWSSLEAWAPPPLVAVTSSHVLLEVGVVFVAWDAAGYAHHWIGHRTRLGWASHQVHHTGEHYDLSLAWRQSWFPWPALVTFPFVALTGGSFVVAVGCAAASNAWQALVHTAAPLAPPRWLRAVVITPGTHRRHHAEGGPVNLGAVLTCWDRLLGTWRPESPVAGPLFQAGSSGGALAIELAGWRALTHRPAPGVICASTPDPAGLVPLNPAEQRGLKLACRSRSIPRTARCSATSSSRRWRTSAPSVRFPTRSAP